jgi:hypothetical protein
MTRKNHINVTTWIIIIYYNTASISCKNSEIKGNTSQYLSSEWQDTNNQGNNLLLCSKIRKPNMDEYEQRGIDKKDWASDILHGTVEYMVGNERMVI